MYLRPVKETETENAKRTENVTEKERETENAKRTGSEIGTEAGIEAEAEIQKKTREGENLLATEKSEKGQEMLIKIRKFALQQRMMPKEDQFL